MKRCHRSTWVQALFLAGMALLASQARGGSTSLQIRNNIVVDKPAILLADLVASPTDLPEGWGERAVLQSPAPGKPSSFPLVTVAYALQKYPDMSSVSLRGEPSITVQRTGIPLDPMDVTRAIETFFKTDEDWKDCPVQITCDPLREKIAVPPNTKTRLDVRRYTEEADSAGYYTFDMDLYADGVLERTLSARAHVTRLKEFWVAATPLMRGQILTAELLRPKMLPVDSERRGYIAVEESVAGYQVDRALRADQPVSRHFIQQPLCTKRGEMISVVAQRGGLRVILHAKALGDGRLGERVLCLNEKSQRRLLVQMTGSKEATIDF